MSALCHNCSCHLNSPCIGCVNCAHPDDECPEGDCQNCECIDRTPEPVRTLPPGFYEELRRREAEAERRRYLCKPYYRREWGYAEVRYFLRPMTRENRDRVVDELISKHTYFGHGWRHGALVIYVD